MLSRISDFFNRWTLTLISKGRPRFLNIPLGIVDAINSWGLVQRFTIASAIVMLLGMLGIGRWVERKIETGVIREATNETALYMDSFVAPNIQELAHSDSISSNHIQVLNELFNRNNLGSRTVSVKIWSKDHRIIYSNIPALVGRKFPNTADQAASWNGEVTGNISNLQEEENVEERRLSSDPLFQIYSPVRLNGEHEIIAVAEFYQKVDSLEAEIDAARRWGWFLVGASMGAIYLILFGFVRWTANRIGQQDLELKNQVSKMTQSLSYYKELNKRVRLAAANTTALNESFLRRTSAELHDGPVQEISLALLRLDRAISQNEAYHLDDLNRKYDEDILNVQSFLQNALREMRAIATGLGVPHLEDLTLPEVISRAVRMHQQQTGTYATLIMTDVPDHANLPIKITVYRFIQEGLNNAYRHADGKGQEVSVTYKSKQLQIEVSDQGHGFDLNQQWNEQLGLTGMRERIESLGGFFSINSKINEGTKLIARLSLQNIGENQ